MHRWTSSCLVSTMNLKCKLVRITWPFIYFGFFLFQFNATPYWIFFSNLALQLPSQLKTQGTIAYRTGLAIAVFIGTIVVWFLLMLLWAEFKSPTQACRRFFILSESKLSGKLPGELPGPDGGTEMVTTEIDQTEAEASHDGLEEFVARPSTYPLSALNENHSRHTLTVAPSTSTVQKRVLPVS